MILGLGGPQQGDFTESGLLQFTDFPGTQSWRKYELSKKMSRGCSSMGEVRGRHGSQGAPRAGWHCPGTRSGAVLFDLPPLHADAPASPPRLRGHWIALGPALPSLPPRSSAWVLAANPPVAVALAATESTLQQRGRTPVVLQ